MDIIKELSALVQLTLNELGAITISLIGLLGIVRLLMNQIKDLFKK